MNTPRVDTASISPAIRGRRNAVEVGRATAPPTAPAPATKAPDRFQSPAVTSRLSRAFKAGLDATRALDSLDAVDTQLKELEALVTQSAKAAPETLAGFRTRIDAVVDSINRAAEAAAGGSPRGDAATIEYTRGAGPSTRLPPWPYEFSNLSEGTEQVRANALLAPGASLDVNVQVTVSAQQAGFYLSFGGAIDLSAATARFVIEIAGNLGTRELSFASGTSVGSMRDAINSFTDVTGVVARLSGPAGHPATGLALKSVEYGDDQFVSVRAVNTGGINTAIATGGVYNLQVTNNNAARIDSSTLFSAASNQVTDIGQDIDGIVNGRNAVGNGRSLYAVTPNLQTQFRLSGAAAQSTQVFRAYTISRNATAGAEVSDEPPLLDPDKFKHAGAPATKEIALAKDRLTQVRAVLTRTREVQRAEAGTLPSVSDAARNLALDPARVRALLTPRSRAR